MEQEQISVCICTFRRTELLGKLLSVLINQVTNNLFTYEIIIVDNDAHRSAEEAVKQYQERNPQIRIIYDCEPIQSIPLARNRAIRNSTGKLLAMIDDDEVPAKDWLYLMHRCLIDYEADGVLGPVLPDFPPNTPAWLIRSGLCNRPRNITGSPLGAKDLRTGNALIRHNIFIEEDKWFDPARGLTGGEDGEFLSRLIRKGRRFVWCDEAVVLETVPEERWNENYYLRRQFRIGTMAGKNARHTRNINVALKTLFLLIIYSALLLLTFLSGKHIWMKILTKLYYNAGCLFSCLKITKVPYRQ